jgi:hypothetical protein
MFNPRSQERKRKKEGITRSASAFPSRKASTPTPTPAKMRLPNFAEIRDAFVSCVASRACPKNSLVDAKVDINKSTFVHPIVAFRSSTLTSPEAFFF